MKTKMKMIFDAHSPNFECKVNKFLEGVKFVSLHYVNDKVDWCCIIIYTEK